jgi:hypothetical protein
LLTGQSLAFTPRNCVHTMEQQISVILMLLPYQDPQTP